MKYFYSINFLNKFLDASNDLILHVVRDGINITIPLRNVNNEYVSYEIIKSENQNKNEICAVRLLTFLPGKILCDVEYTPNLLFECGVLLAKLTNSLEVINEVNRSIQTNNFFVCLFSRNTLDQVWMRLKVKISLGP